MKGALRLFSLIVLLPLASATAQQLPTTTPASTEPRADDGTLVSVGELEQRLTVPVELGAAGPYPFIIDTGAERTVISRELARTLGYAAGPSVMLTSMTGSSRVSTVIVPELMIPAIGQRHRIEAPALAAENLGAAGLLGIDTLNEHEVAIDFETGTMLVRPSVVRKTRPGRRDPDEIVVQAKSMFGQLIVTDAFINGQRIRVVIDTGSQVSMGNSKLRRRVSVKPGSVFPITLTSVTGGKTVADYTLVPKVEIGSVQFDALPIAFADVAPFARFGLSDKPALLLGMDALRSFRRVEIDFANRQVRFLMPKGSGRDRRHYTGSLVPGNRGASPVMTF